MLEHLILAPRSGLCNRLRAIASARRLCRRLGARCSVVWNWGDFEQFFAPLTSVDVVRFGSLCVQRRIFQDKIPTERRAIDIAIPTVKLKTGYVFWGSDENRLRMSQLRELIPRPAERLAREVERFAAAHLREAVGFHIRRTDNWRSIAGSPDELFLERARRLAESGKRIFLATDNCATEALLQRAVGPALVTYPKRTRLKQRWPRKFDPVALEDDLIDLFVLARTEYVLGSSGSSFSEVAIALNGSPLSRKLKLHSLEQEGCHRRAA